MDPARMAHALAPGRITFDEKMVVRKAIEEAGIPHTYVSANCFSGYLGAGLCQVGRITPSRERVIILGDGNTKGTVFSIGINKKIAELPPIGMIRQR
ncbi:hypothetical protein AMTR_s00048p00169570 [Amborella trichopoda]|uniref:NmrA-like domain-containing protein n=1 Tax=Amborella trichopoda TaxID=13333 RepID=U5D058_AMBTC|nr:hypothetical protein AMTR_s00048p00169570 [Amborella trichopoda]